MDSTSLQLASGDASLTIDWLRPEYVEVTLRDGALVATTEVCADVMGVGGMLIAEMAESWRGWEGVKEWTSVEGTFRLTASRDRAGHIALRIHLREGLDHNGWKVEVTLEVEPGQLEGLLRRFTQFESAAPRTV